MSPNALPSVESVPASHWNGCGVALVSPRGKQFRYVCNSGPGEKRPSQLVCQLLRLATFWAMWPVGHAVNGCVEYVPFGTMPLRDLSGAWCGCFPDHWVIVGVPPCGRE